MQSEVYRKSLSAGQPVSNALSAPPTGSSSQSSALSIEVFYPLVTEGEKVMWSHWLPTALNFECCRLYSPTTVTNTLFKLQAPPEVVEEFQWAWKMELFDAYEIRTPLRRDLRDPLLLGIQGGQAYRIALWGESLLPQETIATLVHKSLDIKQRASRSHRWFSSGGALLGLSAGFYMASQAAGSSYLEMGLAFAFLGFSIGWLPTFLYTPENRQQDFLDQYRS